MFKFYFSLQRLLFVCLTTVLMAMPMAVVSAEKDSATFDKASYRYADSNSRRVNANHYKLVVKSKSARKYQVKLRKPAANLANHSLKSQQNTITTEDYDGSGPLEIVSSKALVINQSTGETLFAKNTNVTTPIASVTKLMTAMVVLDAHLAMSETLFIADDDIDYLKGTHSRLLLGTALTRTELLQLALMASENRAASALGRNYPGGINAFVHAMNVKAAFLGMKDTRFVDSTGLDSNNISTADDLAKMVNAAHQYDEIRRITTTASQEVLLQGRHNPLNFVNTNVLVRAGEWNIGLSKTGFINEAGRCLVMQAEISGQPMIIVLLDSEGKYTRIGDANRIRKWFEYHYPLRVSYN